MAIITRSPKRLAKRGQRDVSQVEALAVRAATRAMQQLKTKVVQSFLSHREFEASTVTNQLLPVLQRASAIMHAAGMRRSVLMVNQQLPKAKQDARLQDARWPWTGETIALDLYATVEKLVQSAIDVNMSVLEAQYGPAVGEILAEYSDKIELAVRDKVSELIIKGTPTSDAVEEIQAMLDKMGADGVDGTLLETVFRTQLQTAYNAGRWIEDQDPDIQDILWGYKYVTAGDDRVRESHEALDGTVLPKDDDFWLTYWPPNGWNCRCQVIPLFDEQDIVEPDLTYGPDEGFGGNPGMLFGGLSYSPDEPRDERGQWTSGGGGVGGMAPDKGGGQGQGGSGSKGRAIAKVEARQKAERAARAKAAYNPSTKEKQDESERAEHQITKELGGEKSGDNLPMDVVVDKVHGVELKVMHDAKEGRVNMRPDSRQRKEAWAEQDKKRTLHTVLIDNRDKFQNGAHADKYSGHKIYYAKGVGAFRLHKMEKIGSWKELKEKIRSAK